MTASLAHAVLGLLGRPRRTDDALSFTGGGDPVFVTPWRIASAGAATLGAVGRHLDQQFRAEVLGISEVSIEAEAESTVTYVRRRCASNESAWTTGSGGHRYHETAAIL